PPRPARFPYPPLFRSFSKHAGTLCAGVEPHVLDPEAFRPVRTGLHLLDALYRQAPERWAWVGEERPFIDLLAGGETLRRHLEGRSEEHTSELQSRENL